MLGQTHMIAGALSAALTLQATGAPAIYWAPGLAAGAFASLLPDLDMPGSTAARAIPGYRNVLTGWLPMAVLAAILWAVPRYWVLTVPIPTTLWILPAGAAVIAAVTSFVMREIVTHRGPTHSLACLAAFALGVRLLWPTWPTPLWLSLVAGYGSHALIDLFNPQGAAVLWPLSRRKWSVRDSPVLVPLWPLVVRTGGPGEWGWRLVLAVLFVGVLIWRLGSGPV